MEPKTTEIELSNGARVNPTGDVFFVPTVSNAMIPVERAIHDIAATELPILLEGESGTGKNAAALLIHRLSRWRNEPFLKVNCCATASLDRILRQASSTANGKSKSGAGTLFLDEIGELDAISQSKLLQILPDAVANEGGNRLRVIGSTRRDLYKEVHSGNFREDIYYRVCGVCLRLPPLRERKEDIPALAQHFLSRYATLLARPQPEINAELVQRLVDYSWPGNIRELEYSIQKIIAFGGDYFGFLDLRAYHRERPQMTTEKVSLKHAARTASRQAERELILKVLSRTRWNRKRAAQELQISYKALLYKLKQIGTSLAQEKDNYGMP